VSFAGCKHHRIGVIAQRHGQLQGEIQRGWIAKDARMGHNFEKPAQNDIGDCECGI
jgi:hypothetical protein